MWTLSEIAELLRISARTARTWIVEQNLVEFRLHRVARCKVRVLVTTGEVLRLLNLKRPVFGAGSPEEQIFNRERAMKSRAGLAASANRMARLQRELEKAKEPN